MPASPCSTHSPRLTPAKRQEHAARDARRAEALRENLRRRKQQARDRAAERDAGGHDTLDTEAEPSGPQPGTTNAAG